MQQMRKAYLNFVRLLSLWVALLLAITSVACSEEMTDTDRVNLADPSIESFSVLYGDLWVDGSIDQTNREIIISTITNGDDISEVDYDVSEGTTLSPAPTFFLKRWAAENIITAKSDEKSVIYNLKFPDFVESTRTPHYITVDVGDRKQQIRVIGGDMERCQAYLQNAADPQLVADWLYRDINFSACRVAYDKNQELIEGEKNPAFYTTAIIPSMKNLRAANPYIEFWATMRSDYDGYGDNSNLPDWICSYPSSATPHYFYTEKYAEFLCDYIELLEKNGVELSYLATAKEWSGFVSAAESVEIIEYIIEKCADRGIKCPQFVDQASWSITQGVSFATSIKGFGESTYNLYYGFSTHNLSSSETKSYSDFTAVTNAMGKYAFADESSSGGAGATSGVDYEDVDKVRSCYNEKAEIYRSGMHGELMFELHSRGISSESRNIYYTNGGVGTKMRGYYHMQAFVNAVMSERNTMKNLDYPDQVNPNNKYYVTTTVGSGMTSGEEGIETISFANDDSFALCLVNNTDEEIVDCTYIFNGIPTGKVLDNVIMTKRFVEGASISGITVATEVDQDLSELYLGSVDALCVTIISGTFSDK